MAGRWGEEGVAKQGKMETTHTSLTPHIRSVPAAQGHTEQGLQHARPEPDASTGEAILPGDQRNTKDGIAEVDVSNHQKAPVTLPVPTIYSE